MNYDEYAGKEIVDEYYASLDSMGDKPIVTHRCFACGMEMEWTGEYHEFEVDLITVEEPIYRCVNPYCMEDDDEG